MKYSKPKISEANKPNVMFWNKIYVVYSVIQKYGLNVLFEYYYNDRKSSCEYCWYYTITTIVKNVYAARG